jgi:hypothetical protein
MVFSRCQYAHRSSDLENEVSKYSDGSHGQRGLDVLDIGCRPVVSLAAYLGPVRSGLSSTYLIILAHHDQGG